MNRPYGIFGTKAPANAPAALAGNAMATIQVATSRVKVRLESMQVRRKTGASVTNYTPRVGNVAAFASGDFAQKYQAAATAPGTMVHTAEINKVFFTDASGNLYFTPAGDAADTFDWEITLEMVR